jgi:cobalt/nickel transport system permease protein
MHMADALLSPGTGVLTWVASCAVMSVAARRVQQRADDRLLPLMGMLGAFVFAAQMVNFSIPGTGSSGHLGGGLLLAILLGPHAAFVVVASVLTVQALFFADGGLLALGANMFNLGVLPCYLAYPLVYRPLAGRSPSPRRATFAAVLAAVFALQLGALAVVLQTVASGIASLPAAAFLGLMLPIHLAIGVAEGLATAALLGFLRRVRPELLDLAASAGAPGRRALPAPLILAAALTGGVLSWFASTQPDGLEWSVARVAGTAQPAAPTSDLHAVLHVVQQRLAWLPGYTLSVAAAPEPAPEHPAAAAWPEVNAVTTLAGLVGGTVTFALVMLVGLGLRRRRARHRAVPP